MFSLSGASCATGTPVANIMKIVATSVTSCTPVACASSPSKSFSYQTTCSGTAPVGTGALVSAKPSFAPSQAPIKAGAPTALPTKAPTIETYKLSMVLSGLTAAEFTTKDAGVDHPLTLALKQQIGSVTSKAIAQPYYLKKNTKLLSYTFSVRCPPLHPLLSV